MCLGWVVRKAEGCVGGRTAVRRVNDIRSVELEEKCLEEKKNKLVFVKD